MSAKLQQEIVLAAGLVLSAVNAIQVAAVPLPAWAHSLLAVLSIMAGAVVVRQNVTPTR